VAALEIADFEGILRFLQLAGQVDGADAFPEQLLGQLRVLIPCDVVSWGEFDPRGRGWRCAIAWAGKPRAPVTPVIAEAHRLFQDQDPHSPFGPDAASVLRRSDRLSRRAERRCELYWQVSRPLGSEYMLSVWLRAADRVAGGFAFDRFSRDFSDRDVLVLETLRPHLLQLWRNAYMRLPRADSPLTPRELEILRWVAHGKTNREIAGLLYLSSGTVRKHLENCYAKLGVHTRAGAVTRTFSLLEDARQGRDA
jgi:DNA-binding CsgD family transcriptional regulator